MFWKAAGNFGGRGFQKAVSCSQRAEWWIQTEGGMLPSKNGNVVSEGRGGNMCSEVGEEILSFRSMACFFYKSYRLR